MSDEKVTVTIEQLDPAQFAATYSHRVAAGGARHPHAAESAKTNDRDYGSERAG